MEAIRVYKILGCDTMKEKFDDYDKNSTDDSDIDIETKVCNKIKDLGNDATRRKLQHTMRNFRDKKDFLNQVLLDLLDKKSITIRKIGKKEVFILTGDTSD
jgi:hypothetical protein